MTTECSINTGDTAWVMLCTVLVLSMAPGVALFEAGLLRRKNTLSVLVQIMSGVIILQAQWFLFGYSLTFHGDVGGGFIGTFGRVGFTNMDHTCPTHLPNVPELAFAVFQSLFSAITPLLITGAWAERMKFRSVMLMLMLWSIVVYYPVAHWIWSPHGWLAKLHVYDFAGGIVVHTTAGVASLVVALVLGRREGFDEVNGEFKPHNLPLAAIGTAFLWTGWNGFNAGSTYEAGYLAAIAVTNTAIASASCGVVFLFLSAYHHNGAIRVIDVMNGIISGLAGITPCVGYVTPPVAVAIGFLLGFVSWFSTVLIKEKWRIDDALDVSCVHGAPGVFGAICTGFVASSHVNPAVSDGWFYGNASQVWRQLFGIAVVAAWTAFWTYVLLKGKELTVGLKVSLEDELLGLDLAEHGSHSAYHNLHDNGDASAATSDAGSQIGRPEPLHTMPWALVRQDSKGL